MFPNYSAIDVRRRRNEVGDPRLSAIRQYGNARTEQS